MAIYPEARQEILTTRSFFPLVDPVRFNLHTAITNAETLFRFFQYNEAGTYSHFFVAEDGTVIQYVDTKFRAACDLEGNSSTISVETWDGATYPIRKWTPAQEKSLAKLYLWVMEMHPTIPFQLATDNRRVGTSSHGLSCHRFGIPGYSAFTKSTGGIMYSTANLKECPGEARFAQIPAIFEMARTLQSEENELTPEQDELLKAISSKLDGLDTRLSDLDARVKVLETASTKMPNDVAMKVHTWPINRGGVATPFIQEVANIMSKANANGRLIAETQTAIKTIPTGITTQEVEDLISKISTSTTINIAP